MGKEFINNIPRYCLWLKGINPKELKSMPAVLERVRRCKEDRLNGAKDRQKLAATPWLFREQLNPQKALAVPVVSSERREYIPMDFIDSLTIAGNKLFLIEDASLELFGILTSSVHNDWMRTVAGRLKSDFSYSKSLVYNTFPFVKLTDTQKQMISETAQAILDARKLYPDSSLADLYDPLTMPIELRKAHKANDKVVLRAYGLKPSATEQEIVQYLFAMYSQLTGSEKK